MASFRPTQVGFIGAGRAGTALALALSSAGYLVAAVASRTGRSSQRLADQIPGCTVARTPQALAERCDLVFITTPDDAIGVVAGSLRWRPGQAVVHCSGAQSLDLLEAARSQGALVGAFHPLQTFAGPDGASDALKGTTFAIEAEPGLGPVLEELAERLGGCWVHLRAQDRALYHASAVAACGFLVALVGQAAQLWEAFGYDEQQALQALLPMIKGTVQNLEGKGLPGALTGPLARGDALTVRKHLEALQARAPGFLHLYCHLALASLPMAQRQGKLESLKAQELRLMLERALGQPSGEEVAAGFNSGVLDR